MIQSKRASAFFKKMRLSYKLSIEELSDRTGLSVKRLKDFEQENIFDIEIIKILRSYYLELESF